MIETQPTVVFILSPSIACLWPHQRKLVYEPWPPTRNRRDWTISGAAGIDKLRNIHVFSLWNKYNVRCISHGWGQLWGKGGLGFATGRVHYTSHVECRAVTLGTRRLGTSMLLSLIEEIHAFETVLRRNGSDAFFARACRCCRCFEIRVQMWLTQ